MLTKQRVLIALILLFLGAISVSANSRLGPDWELIRVVVKGDTLSQQVHQRVGGRGNEWRESYARVQCSGKDIPKASTLYEGCEIFVLKRMIRTDELQPGKDESLQGVLTRLQIQNSEHASIARLNGIKDMTAPLQGAVYNRKPWPKTNPAQLPPGIPGKQLFAGADPPVKDAYVSPRWISALQAKFPIPLLYIAIAVVLLVSGIVIYRYRMWRKFAPLQTKVKELRLAKAVQKTHTYSYLQYSYHRSQTAAAKNSSDSSLYHPMPKFSIPRKIEPLLWFDFLEFTDHLASGLGRLIPDSFRSEVWCYYCGIKNGDSWKIYFWRPSATTPHQYAYPMKNGAFRADMLEEHLKNIPQQDSFPIKDRFLVESVRWVNEWPDKMRGFIRAVCKDVHAWCAPFPWIIWWFKHVPEQWAKQYAWLINEAIVVNIKEKA